MPRIKSSVAGAAALALVAVPTFAFAQATPVSVSGFNADLVVSNTATAPYDDDADAFDVPNNYAYYEIGLEGSVSGLPVGGAFTADTSGTVFDIADYASDNALLMTASNTTGTLTFDTPTAFDSISILAVSTNGGGTGAVTFNFQDGTSLTTDYQAPDWFGNNTGTTPGGNAYMPAIQGIGRVSVDPSVTQGVEQYATDPDMYETMITLSGQTVTSMDFTGVSAGASTTTGVFGISGVASAVPEPASLGLLGMAGLALVRRRRA